MACLIRINEKSVLNILKQLENSNVKIKTILTIFGNLTEYDEIFWENMSLFVNEFPNLSEGVGLQFDL